MTKPEVKHEVIDVDDLDIFCTGVRHCVHIDRAPSPHQRKRARDPVTISLVDSDNEDTKPAFSSWFKPPPDTPSVDQCTELQRITQLELSSRIALRDTHPTKKRATDAINMATNLVKSHSELRQRDRVQEVLEISSDSEPEPWPSKAILLQRPRVDIDGQSDHLGNSPKLEAGSPRPESHSPGPSYWYHSSNDDDDCINFLASLDISNEGNWVPLPESNKAEDLTPVNNSACDPSKSQPVPPLRIPRKKPPIDHRRLPFDWALVSTWGTASKNYGISMFPRPFFHARRQEQLFPVRSPSLYYERGYTKLGLTAKYPHLMSGSINKIIQLQGSVVVCAVVEGGLEDSDDDDEDQPLPPPENRPGSLVVHRRGQVHVQPAHCHPHRAAHVMKYYSVNDIAFNPHHPRQFLSSGNDLVVRMWEIFDCDDNDGRVGLGAIRGIPFDSKPQDLVYAPDGSALAITCYDGTVRLYTQDLFEDMIDVALPSKRFRAGPRLSGHAAGCTLWGKGPSGRLLFSSSEPTQRGDYSGYHCAFDTCKGSVALQLDATESGDAATLSPNGETLALFTSGKDGKHPVRLYDVRRKCKHASQTAELEKFRARPIITPDQELDESAGEVNQASFSPDGYLLAVARNDNSLHVYDMRVLSRGPLCRFEHHDSDAIGGGGCGTVAVNWIQGRDRVGIASGGNDGCVRLWEPALGATGGMQGMVIGRSDFDVGHFSVGNPQNGELPLIIGDSGGGVHTYDFTNPDGTPI